jgi:hypothetical protein
LKTGQELSEIGDIEVWCAVRKVVAF